MIYLTYNDLPSGVFYSQVTDVCNHVNARFKCEIRLVSLISIRGFIKNKKKIKQTCPNAIVLPMIPKHKNWRLNKLTLKLLFIIIGKQNIWSRGVFATNIALELRKAGWINKVVFDARGAYEAEFEEYLHKVVDINEIISLLENNAVNKSDFRLAISNQLVNYWCLNYNYLSRNHVIIPCTLSKDATSKYPSEDELVEIRNKLGFKPDDIVFVYSGSTADWQSMNMVDDFMLSLLNKNLDLKLLILSTIKVENLKINKLFKDRISQYWVKPNEVIQFLYAGDYGILLRENSITNQVSSPTKFAEYLNAGLQIILSESIGDFSNFTKKQKCGCIIKDIEITYSFCKLSYSEKQKNHQLAQSMFTKSAYDEQYEKIVLSLKENIFHDKK